MGGFGSVDGDGVTRPQRGFLRLPLTVSLGLFVVGLPVLALFINWSA